MPSKKFSRNGYVLIYKPNHPYASKWGYVSKSRLIIEEWLGTYLPKDAVIHHVNGVKDDNRLENLQIFYQSNMHTNYHRNQKAKTICGHGDWRQCVYCHEYGDPKSELWHQLENGNAYHKKCKSNYDRRRYERVRFCEHRTQQFLQ